jgi:kynurenine formamidase
LRLRIHHTLKPLEIVLINTRAGSRYGYEDYINTDCGMGYEATMYLLERGIRLVCFPTKIRAASAGWTRAIAILEESD